MLPWIFIATQAVLAIIVIGLSFSLWRNQKALFRKQRELESRLNATMSCQAGMDKSLNRLERHVKHLENHTEVSTAGNKSYNQASRMFELGASRDDVINNCHLSRGEAELIFQLSQAARRHNQPPAN